MIGETISHYRVIEKIGEGGMGVVYLAEHMLLGRRVAIKTLLVSGAEHRHFRSRFLREAQAVSKLSHPNIANIYDYGEAEDGQPYIVMELIDGKTLDNLMREEGVSIPRAITIVKQVAAALSEAHRHGIVHRDIKPSNIAINKDDVVKVLDFGLAKHVAPPSAIDSGSGDSAEVNTQTREGIIVGTPLYLSPEQALGVEVDARSDLFSLGSVLYECIAGRPPFAGKSAIDICAKVIRDDPPLPSVFNSNVSAELDRISLKAMSKKPEARFQTAVEMLASLETASHAIDIRHSNQPVRRQIKSGLRARSTSALATLSDIFRRPRWSIGYVLAGMLLLVLLGLILSRLTRATLPPPPPAAQQVYEKGLAALREGSYLRASKLFERALAVDDKFALAHARLAEAYTELDYADRAKNEMLSAARIVIDRSMLDRKDALYYEAIQASVTRDFTGAIKSYEELSKLSPNDDAAYLDLGRAYEDHDETDKAIEQYSQASGLNPINPAPLLRLGMLYGRRQDLAKSNAAFDKADSLYQDEQNIEGNSEVAYQRGYLLNQMSHIPEARDAAQHSLEVAKLAGNQYQQVRALLLLSAVAYSSGDTAAAQPLATQALELARANGLEDLATQGLLDLSNASLLRRSFDDAENYARQGLDLAQRYKEKRNAARANLLLGSNYIQREKGDRGAAFIEQAMAFYSAGGYRREVSRCMIMKGRVQLLTGDYDGALKTLDEQLQLAKQVEDLGELARSQQEVAAALSKLDFYPQALNRYAESYALSSHLGNPLRAGFALLNQADMLARLGRLGEADEALNTLSNILNQLPNTNQYSVLWAIYSHLIRAQMLVTNSEFAKAKNECEMATRLLNPTNQPALGNSAAQIKALTGLTEVYLGLTSLGIKHCLEATTIQTATTERSSGDANLDLILAQALFKGGDAGSSRAAAARAGQFLATNHHPESEWRARVIAALASKKLHDTTAVKAEAARASEILASLEKLWGEEAFIRYSTRLDIAEYQQQLKELL